MLESPSYEVNRLDLTVAEYFAGIGLVRMGLEASAWQVVFANDFSAKKLSIYKTFFPDADGHYIVDDIFNLAPSEIPPALLATCSFPCIDLSLAGNMNGLKGKHSSAFWGFIDILRAQNESAPPLILVENVPGWLSSNKGADFRVAVKALNETGYACDVFVLDARSFVPQSRERVFLIGAKHRPPMEEPEALLNRPPLLTSKRLREALAANMDLDWTFIDIPVPPPKLKSGLFSLLEDLAEDDPRWWSLSEVKRHLEMMAPTHRTRVEKMRQMTSMTSRTFYRRVRKGKQRVEVRGDGIAGCLRTAVGGSSRQFIVKAGQGHVWMRAMTPREYARLQGVPDWFPIDVDDIQAINGFGDAVCVPVISWIARHALAQLVRELQSDLATNETALRAAYPRSILRDLSVSD